MLSARSIERRTRTAMSVSCRGVGDGLARVTSIAVRITVSGVRSSCEALATNTRWAVNAAGHNPAQAARRARHDCQADEREGQQLAQRALPLRLRARGGAGRI